MPELVNGRIRGFRWYELPRSVCGDVSKLPGNQDADVVTVICAENGYPQPYQIDNMLAGVGNHLRPTIGFTPIDVERDMPGRLVGYDHFSKDEVLDWLRDNATVPGGIEVEYEWGPIWRTPLRVNVVARTMKDGRIVKVRRHADPGKPFADEIARIFTWMEKNAPKPPLSGGMSCGRHLLGILSHATAEAVDMVREWVAKNDDARDPMEIPPTLLPGTGVTELRLKSTKTSNTALSEITLKGGHKIVDDPTGITVTLKIALPTTVLNTIGGMNLGQIIDLPWTSTIQLKSVREEFSDAAILKGYAPGVALDLPDAKPMTAEAAKRIVAGLFEKGVYANVDAATRSLLLSIEPQKAATILLALQGKPFYDLGVHGLPGWVLQQYGDRVETQRSPHVEKETFLEDFAAGSAGTIV